MLDKLKLEGFLVDVHCASESNLEIEMDASSLDWDKYKDLINELEDVLNKIDEATSAKAQLVKGRSLRASYRRVAAEERTRSLRFSPLPSRFSNMLKNTRTYMYELVHANCLVLERTGMRQVYLLPKELAPFFIEAVDQVNVKVIDKLRKDIEEFRKTADYLSIKQCLYKYGLSPQVLDASTFTLGDFMINIIPVDFGYSVDADDIYAAMNHNLTMKGLSLLQQQIEQKRREYATSSLKELVARILSLTEAKKVVKPQAKIQKLIGICRALNLEQFEKILNSLQVVLTGPAYSRQMLSQAQFGTTDLKAGVENALHALQVLEED